MNNITINYIINDITGDMKMEYIIESEKQIEIIKESEIKKANKYSYKTIIPKEVMEVFPQLKESGKLIFHIKEVEFKKYRCEIKPQAKGLKIYDVQESEIKDDKESASNNVDDDSQKPVETKTTTNDKTTDAGNKKADKKGENKYEINAVYPTRMNDYKLRLKQTNYTKTIEIINADTEKRYKTYYKGATNRPSHEIQIMMDKLSQCESLEDAKKIFDSYA